MNLCKTAGFVIVMGIWVWMTILCYFRVVAFESRTLGEAMLLGFILTSSVLGIIQLLKIVYDKTYAALAEEKD
jgi:hypothetical protein